MEDMEEIGPPPGSIIYSPQDITGGRPGTSKTKRRSHGSRKSLALTVKMEEGIDYIKINMPVACEICGKLMANGRVLVQHMTSHSVNKAFQCPHCPKSFTRMVHLQGHLVFHGIQKQFECPVCHQRFSRQDCVRVHMRLHDKTKCVFCDVCHKAFLTAGALNIHMRIHRGEKPFKCHLCGKCFTQKNHVITHIKRHTKLSEAPFQKKLGPRMFQCEHCPRSFIRLSDYERHVQWNHGAVSDAAMVSTVNENLGLGNFNDEMFANDVTLDSKVRKRPFGPVGTARRTMCSIGTQTDDETGHVIIPRKYQNAASMTSSGTQMSAPPTPRHEDDMYDENDIYDEGMDRNYSSDEDETLETVEKVKQDIELVSNSTQETDPTANDEAFDAVLGKVTNKKSKNIEEGDDEQIKRSEIEEKEKNKNEDNVVNENEEDSEEVVKAVKKKKTENPDTNKLKDNEKEVASLPTSKEPANKKGGTPTAKREASQKVEQAKPITSKTTSKPSVFKTPINVAPRRTIMQDVLSDNEEHDPMIREESKDKEVATTSSVKRPSAKILDTFNINTKNWRGRGRGRGRPRPKGIVGLTGATHLRLVRKSMMNFITEKTEQLNESIKKGDDVSVVSDSPSKKSPNKRQGRAKPHSPDFVCNSKLCEMCNPSQDNKTESEGSGRIKNEPHKDQSAKLLQFLVSGDAKTLRGTDFRVVGDVNRLVGKISNDDIVMAIDASRENPEVSLDSNRHTEEVLQNLRERAEFFSATAENDDISSPPVELQSFCIPTFSCKLCGREFRFEGKLHRHIEAVHQKKEIFSPDVKPGRGSFDPSFATAFSVEELSVVNAAVSEASGKSPHRLQQNPEIEALRSEWDDDDAENSSELLSSTSSHKPSPLPTAAAAAAALNAREKKRMQVASMLANQNKQEPIYTRAIVPVTNTVSDVFLSGVKVNINKLSGLADFEAAANYSTVERKKILEPHQPPSLTTKENVSDTLDTKCQKLLQKLFDHTLLVNCGLYQEHVSIVLGKILQHYGVKMIEDYGQGQYEVLKYNLWRLIEWKVTMEQMEEFYTEGKSVEEMMDDIMNGRVPIIAHHDIIEASTSAQPTNVEQTQQQPTPSVNAVETVQIADNQLVLSQVANVLGGQLNLGDGVTQVVLAQDVSPELLQGAHIVTIDPSTGQVISQVTADQVILSDELGQQIQTIDGQVVTTAQQPPGVASVVTTLPPGSIVTTSIAENSLNKM